MRSIVVFLGLAVPTFVVGSVALVATRSMLVIDVVAFLLVAAFVLAVAAGRPRPPVLVFAVVAALYVFVTFTVPI